MAMKINAETETYELNPVEFPGGKWKLDCPIDVCSFVVIGLSKRGAGEGLLRHMNDRHAPPGRGN
jgi:hypothetical protein